MVETSLAFFYFFWKNFVSRSSDKTKWEKLPFLKRYKCLIDFIYWLIDLIILLTLLIDWLILLIDSITLLIDQLYWLIDWLYWLIKPCCHTVFFLNWKLIYPVLQCCNFTINLWFRQWWLLLYVLSYLKSFKGCCKTKMVGHGQNRLETF